MSTDSARSAIWNWALGSTIWDEPLRFSEAATSVGVELTQKAVRDTLNVMSFYGWLSDVSSLGIITPTTEDVVWDWALKKSISGDLSKLSEAKRSIGRKSGVSGIDVQDILDEMCEYRWLERENKWARAWEPGPRTQRLSSHMTKNDKNALATSDSVTFTADELRELYVETTDDAKLIMKDRDGNSYSVTHGKIGGSVLIPYHCGEPVKHTIPRLEGDQCSVVYTSRCRYLAGDSEGEINMTPPRLHIGDEIAVSDKVVTETKKYSVTHELNEIPLVVFQNVDSLELEGDRAFTGDGTPTRRVVVEITGVQDRVAQGDVKSRRRKYGHIISDPPKEQEEKTGKKNSKIRSPAGEYSTWMERKKHSILIRKGISSY